MKENFKYPILSTFFDADNIPCVFVDEVLKTFPGIEKFEVYYPANKGERDFNSFGWSIGTENVMASADAELFIDMYNRTLKQCKSENITLDDIAVCEVAICSVCDELLMPDDECYVDEYTGEPLCDGHSVTNEETGNYVKCDGKNFKYIAVGTEESLMIFAQLDKTDKEALTDFINEYETDYEIGKYAINLLDISLLKKIEDWGSYSILSYEEYEMLK